MLIPAPDTTAPRGFRTSTVAEQIAEHLSAQMVAGVLKPREQIVEHKIAELFGISRGPVRDALRILEKQGLVKIEPRRGASVVEMSLNDVIDLFNARAMLLCLSVRYLAVAQDAERIAQMDAKLREFELAVYEPSITADGFMRALGRLGLTMLNATPSQPLINAFNSLSHATVWRQVWKDHAFAYESVEGRQRCYEAYRQVFDAIRAADADRASMAMERFSVLVRDTMVERMRPQRAESIDEFRLRCF